MGTGGSPRITYVAHDLAMGEWKNVCFAVWRAKPTVESALILQERYLALAKQAPGGFFAFGVIEAGVPNPDPPAHRAITAAMDAVENELLGAAVALEATGFAAAALRAALATMSMLTRVRSPRGFFGSVDEAAIWTARLMPDVGGPSELMTSFHQFRASI